jgi:hypothetical protein
LATFDSNGFVAKAFLGKWPCRKWEANVSAAEIFQVCKNNEGRHLQRCEIENNSFFFFDWFFNFINLLSRLQ